MDDDEIDDETGRNGGKNKSAVAVHRTTHPLSHSLFLAKLEKKGITAICQLTCTTMVIP